MKQNSLLLHVTLALMTIVYIVEAHPGFEYSDTRVEGPCPALNTLSNHGILPRDGMNVPTSDIIKYLEEIFSVSALDVIMSRVEDLTHINSDGVKVLDYPALWTSHTNAALVHQDLYLDPTGRPDPELLDGLEKAAGDDGILTWEELADWRDVRVADSLERNPEFGYIVDQIHTTVFNSLMMFYGFGSDPLVATVNISDVMSFMREDHFPEHFVPRTHRGEEPRSFVKDALLASIRQFFSDRLEQSIPSIVESDEQPTVQQCIGAFTNLQFDIFDYDKYPLYFHEDSKVILSEAGIYKGPKNIEEYMHFGDESSPYINKRTTLYLDLKFKEVDKRTGICVFNAYNIVRIESNPEFAKETTLLQGSLYQIHYDYHEIYVPEVRLHLETDYLEFLFGNVLTTPAIRDFICDVSEACPDTNVGMSHEECTEQLQQLPTLSENGAFDGKDYGCRVLHAVFAATNHDHCAHMSFAPQKDPNGFTKCQVPSGLQSLDFFDADDLQEWWDFLEEKKSLIESTSGYKVLDKPKDVDERLQIVMAVGVPSLLFVLVYVLVSISQRRQGTEADTKSGPMDPVISKLARQLWILVVVYFGCLIVFNALAGVVLWYMARTKQWEGHPSDDDDLRDQYHGEPGLVDQTVPTELMTDDQFLLYTGFVVWMTTVLSGLGMEAFVWNHFLQAWSQNREVMWRFVQFIFPLMLMTALGLSIHHNFLAIPVLVLGLWKFGFPETLMYLYLGMFASRRRSTCLTRMVDLMNGAGTVLHHGAASMVVSMLVVGVIPSSRGVLNGALILVIQHWIALVAYGSRPLYCGLAIVLEYFFEWIILSDFSELYYLHWTAALGAGVMLFAHWMYFIAGFLSLFDVGDSRGDYDDDDDSRSSDNVHTRGNREISARLSLCSPSPKELPMPAVIDDAGGKDVLDASMTSVCTSINSTTQDMPQHQPLTRRQRMNNTNSGRRRGSRLLAGRSPWRNTSTIIVAHRGRELLREELTGHIHALNKSMKRPDHEVQGEERCFDNGSR